MACTIENLLKSLLLKSLRKMNHGHKACSERVKALIYVLLSSTLLRENFFKAIKGACELELFFIAVKPTLKWQIDRRGLLLEWVFIFLATHTA